MMSVLNELFVKRFRKLKRGKMIIVEYKSKRKLKKDIGKPLACICSDISAMSWRAATGGGKPFFVTNSNRTFYATVVMENGIIISVG